MATLAADKARKYQIDVDPEFAYVPVIAADIIYAGAAVGESSTSGTGRPLVAGDAFMGFADAKADNSAGAAGDKNVTVRQRGAVEIPVTGASAITTRGDTVYASDDDTFTLTAGSNTAIGKVVNWVSGTTCRVAFEADVVRSI